MHRRKIEFPSTQRFHGIAALGVRFMPFALILMMGASCAFINPAGFQTNLMVQGPGGYSFGDFAKVGLPLTAVVAIVMLMIAPSLTGSSGLR
jgi:di/tricarboxylate transporter